MANQVDPATVGGASAAVAAGQDASVVHGESTGAVASPTNVAQLGPYPAFHGRTISWVAVSIIMAGFLVGGLALILGQNGPLWWLFWTGIGISVLGLLATLATNTFQDWY